MEVKNIKVFVYGTLKEGYRNHYLLSELKGLKNIFVKGTLYSIEGVDYPAFIDEGDFDIQGEVYEVDRDTLSKLDELEGFFEMNHVSNLYERKEMMAYDGNNQELYVVSVYVYCNPEKLELSQIQLNNY